MIGVWVWGFPLVRYLGPTRFWFLYIFGELNGNMVDYLLAPAIAFVRHYGLSAFISHVLFGTRFLESELIRACIFLEEYK